MFVRRAVFLTTLLALASQAPAFADQAQIDRGHYLVTLSGCSDCHTPGALLGTPDKGRVLGGSDVGFGIPGVGVFVGPNLTPDKETGLGKWTDAQIIAAMTAGKRPDGRALGPNDKPDFFVSVIVPGAAYSAMQTPPK
jgi:mono/diheme cytochrome c family protein